MAASNTTVQQIVQVQISGCVSNCQGASQTQTATQQNTTVQTVASPPAAATATPDSGGAVSASDPGSSSVASSVTQIQLGCLDFCFGTTTLQAAGDQLEPEALAQLLAGLGWSSPALSDPAAAAERNVTDQTASQTQVGQDGTGAALQSATQVATTVQAGVGSTVVNQTAQGIWQVQVGCIFDCVGTQQTQQAEQSSSTLQVLGGTPGSAGAAAPTAVNTTVALVWQLQIGCLFWCYDAVEVQTAGVSQLGPVVVSGAPTEAALSGGQGGGTGAPAANVVPVTPVVAIAPASPTGPGAPGRSSGSSG